MTSEVRTGLPYRRGRSDDAGFRAVIKAVATGPRGSRAAVRLYAGGRCESVSAGVALATKAVQDGRASATLEALLAT